jgi:hypothetical protein
MITIQDLHSPRPRPPRSFVFFKASAFFVASCSLGTARDRPDPVPRSTANFHGLRPKTHQQSFQLRSRDMRAIWDVSGFSVVKHETAAGGCGSMRGRSRLRQGLDRRCAKCIVVRFKNETRRKKGSYQNRYFVQLHRKRAKSHLWTT